MIAYRNIKWKKIALHSLVWICGLGLFIVLNLLGYIKTTQGEESFTLIQRLEMLFFVLEMYILCLIIPFYINRYFLIPRLWHRYNAYLYFLGLIIFIVLLLLFLEWLEYIAAGFLVGLGFFILIMIQTLIQLSVEGMRDRKKLKAISQEQSEMELKLLKTQINPHFLFNALNNLYSHSLFQPQQTPDAILQLASLMRYSIESSKKTSLLLKDEVNFIQSYIYLEQMRLNPNKVKIESSFDEIPDDLQIAPMLLIPFVENAFKHGIAAVGGHIFIQLKIAAKNSIEFIVQNSIAPVKTIEDKRQSTYTGLQNTQKRLALLYPNHYQLDIEAGEKEFRIYLKISL